MTDNSEGTAALRLAGIEAGYGKTTVLRDVDVSVPKGSVVALIGANGAGKTTLLRVASGLLRPTQGTVLINGQDCTRWPPYKRAKDGVCLIPEGRGIFRSLTVRDNLELEIPPWSNRLRDIEAATSAFPVLKGRLRQIAGSLSGGEQQMLALARAYLAAPSILLVDELSIGLAPVAIDALMESVQQIASTGVTLLLVEQYIDRILHLADTVYLMARGQMRWTGTPATLEQSGMLEAYLGSSEIIQPS
jgi:branched-chain amino acid transport system ATP-binding protein